MKNKMIKCKENDCASCIPECMDLTIPYEKAAGLIDNKPVVSDELIGIKSPIDLEACGSFYGMSLKDVDRAYASAAQAFKTWSKTTLNERAKILLKFADLLELNREQITRLMVNQIAKAYKESLVEVERTVEYIRDTVKVYEDLVKNPLVIDETVNGVKGKTGYFFREPLGVVLCIAPFNYPINTAIGKIAPALMAGNTVVFKPSTQGSVIGIRFSELLVAAGIPVGVYQCVVGRGSKIGDALNTNKYLSAISFTGSTKIGLELLKMTPSGNVFLELGGKDAAIVLEDANLEKTAKELIKGAFSYSGQRCTAIKRILVVKKVAKQLTEILTREVSKLELGNPKDNPGIVPVVDEPSAKYIMELVEDAKNKGAKILVGGKCERNWIQATLIGDVTEDMRIAWEEPFGPVLPIIEVEDEADAIRIANASEYGLQGSIFTENEERAKRIVPLLEVGTVNLNRSSSRGPDIFPFLGVKNSGVGVQGIRDALISLTRYKGFIVNK
ncbi:aldehyde dehydrogenase family protein [[Mycoplasma] testudinis]|uniref:aldehyde dehydrogenase family protein n=1 Tax=[Mycoplasma] testudinis TaxID=33924 RepID=UPI000696F7CD|nr:aldehyde dehydrogenase family protein [[Mycoplasma] testudinis]